MARDIVGAWIREIKKKERDAVSGQKAAEREHKALVRQAESCLLYTSPSPRDQRGSRMPSSA